MDVIDYYAGYDEKTRLFRSRARTIEYLTTIHKLEKYITPGGSVLEIGAAYGAYTKYFADRGIKILAADIVPGFVDELRTGFSDRTNFRAMILDAKDLSILGNELFDLILCMGPCYHTQDRQGRLKIFQNCREHLPDGGIIAVSYINSHFAFMNYYRLNRYMDEDEIREFEKADYRNLESFDPFTGFSYYTTPEEIEAETADAGFRVLENIGTDGIYSFISENLEKMDDEQYRAFLEHHYRTCTCRSIIGLSNHGLIICEK